MAWIVPLIPTIASVASSATSIGTGIANTVQAQKAAQQDPAKQQAILQQRLMAEQQRAKLGSGTTLLTGPQGVLGGAPLGKRTLLGG